MIELKAACKALISAEEEADCSAVTASDFRIDGWSTKSSLFISLACCTAPQIARALLKAMDVVKAARQARGPSMESLECVDQALSAYDAELAAIAGAEPSRGL
jgi:hypothetical protein